MYHYVSYKLSFFLILVWKANVSGVANLAIFLMFYLAWNKVEWSAQEFLPSILKS